MPIRADRHGDGRDQRRPEAAEEEEDDQHDEDEGLDQSVLDHVDGGRDEGRRVVGDLPFEILGEGFRGVGHLGLDRGERLQRVRARRLIDADQGRRRAVEARRAVEVRRAKLKARDVGKAQHRAVRIGADDDLLEIRDGGQPPLGLDIELQLLVVGDRPRADAPDGGLHVLALHRFDDVGRSEPEAGQAVGAAPRPLWRSPAGRKASRRRRRRCS